MKKRRTPAGLKLAIKLDSIPRKSRMKRSYLEERFEKVIQLHTLPEPVREFVFHGWRFDFAWPLLKVVVEVDGGTYIGGAHVKGKGYERDCKKNNKAQLEGWVVLRADRNMVATYEFATTVKRMLNRRISQLNSGRKQW